MNINYSFSYKGYSACVTADEPNVCPCCKHSLKPTVLYKELILDNNSVPNFYIVYLCTSCYEIFVCRFDNLKRNTSDSNYSYSYIAQNLVTIAPSKFEKQEFEDCINTVSPSFVKIYNQALESEHYSLDEIAGIGYRKALEFLIKDYCILKNPSKNVDISKKPLAQCIENYIDDLKLKKTAKASTWLGNDETHYLRKFTDKDINDLKKFINTTVYFILYNLNVDEADEILNSK